VECLRDIGEHLDQLLLPLKNVLQIYVRKLRILPHGFQMSLQLLHILTQPSFAGNQVPLPEGCLAWVLPFNNVDFPVNGEKASPPSIGLRESGYGLPPDGCRSAATTGRRLGSAPISERGLTALW
jgi:hypothetical protein